MSQRGLRRQLWAQAGVAVGMFVLVLAGLVTVASAKDKAGPPGVDVAATYSITANVGDGPQAIEPFVIGDLTISADCTATYYGGLYPYGVGIGGSWTATNNGDNPIAFFIDDAPEWLASGEATGGAGEWVNEGFLEGNAMGYSFAILDHSGSSATGMFAWSARVNEGVANVDGDEFGECVFTLHARG